MRRGAAARARPRCPRRLLLLGRAGGRAFWLGRRSGPLIEAKPGAASCSSPSTPCARTRSAPTARPDAGTPWIDRLAAAGVRFEDAHAHNVVTLPSHANILSGRYPFEHGVRDNAGFRFPPGTDTLATLLKARGYATGRVRERLPARRALRPRPRLRRLRRPASSTRRPRPAFLDAGAPRRGDRGRAPSAGSRAGRSARASAGSTSTSRTRPTRRPSPSPRASRRDPYQGEVAAADAALGPAARAAPARRPRPARTLVVLTADHGESLGEHGEATHGIFAYEATLRVPLILYAPRLVRAARRGARRRATSTSCPRSSTRSRCRCRPDLPGRSLLAAGGGRDARGDRRATSRRSRGRSTAAGRRCRA